MKLKLKEEFHAQKVVCPMTRREITMNFVAEAAYTLFHKYFPQFFEEIVDEAFAKKDKKGKKSEPAVELENAGDITNEQDTTDGNTED